MRIPPGIRRAVRLPLTGDRIVRELDDEVRMHLAMRVEMLVGQGYSREQATTEALRRFGDVDDLKDYCVSIEVAHMQRTELNDRIGGVLQDLRFAFRQIRTAPAFTLIAAFTLALGIGATSAIFSVVSQVVLKPLPFPSSDRLMQLWEVSKRGNDVNFTEPNFDDLQKLNKSFSAMAHFGQGSASLVVGGEGVRATVAEVSSGFFDILRVKPAYGRLPAPDEGNTGGSAVVVISYGFWQRQFAGAQSVLGSTFKIDNQSATVVGVLPPNTEFPPGSDVIVQDPVGGPKNTSRTAHNFHVVARLKDGVTVPQARLDVSTIMRQLKAQYGGYMDASDGAVRPIQDEIAGPIKPMLFLLLGASGILLLIACANVVNLLVARMAARENELAVRLAIGAGRSRLIQQLLVEASVLAGMGCAGGLALALAGVKALVVLHPRNIPGVENVAIDWRVLIFAILVSAATAFALGVIAAWRGARADLRAALSQGRRSGAGGGAVDRIRGTLVVGQISMTVVLLIGAGLLARSFVHLLSIEPGFRTSGVVVAKIAYGSAGTPEDMARRVQYFDDVIAGTRTIPGVTATGGVSAMPLGDGYGDGTFLILNGPDEKIEMKDFERLFQDKQRTGNADYRVASAEYFKAMNIPLVSGRFFDDGDRAGAPEVAVISVSLAKGRWPSENPIGKVIEFGNMDGDLAPITIVGVVGDVHEANLAAKPRAAFYVSYRQRPAYARQFDIVMATPSSASVMASARPIFRAARPDIPVTMTTIEDLVSRSLSQQRFMLVLVGVFGAVALILATLGVYSVVSYVVAQRGHELSIRVALGATGGDVVGLVLRQGAAMAVVGMLVGTAGAVAATRVLKTLLYDVSPTDPVAFGGVILTLAIVALAASYLPARRAGRIAPMDVLRGG